MGYWKVEYKKGLRSPAYVYAESQEMAEKMGLAEFMRTSGHSETVDMFSTVKNTVEKVILVEEIA